MNKYEILLCPLCGSRDINYEDDMKWYNIRCQNCGCCSGTYNSLEESIKNWNNRVASSETINIIEGL